jgi:hypothetical protein
MKFNLEKITNVQNQCRGEPCVRPLNNNRLRTYVRGKRI